MGVRVQFGEGRLLAEKFNALGFRRKGFGHSGFALSGSVLPRLGKLRMRRKDFADEPALPT